MAGFLQNLFSRLTGPRTGRTPQIYLGAFGKHPGWNDHIDDLGLETDRLVAIKRIFYVQGIAGNIDSGAWDKLTDDQQLKHFNHVFVWRIGDDFVIGRLWSSSDGKGRTRYPMIVVAHCTAIALPWALEQVLPRLEKIEADCLATTEPDVVRLILDTARQELRALVASAEAASSEPADDSNALSVLAARPEMGEDHKGLLCILYQIDREMGAFRPGSRLDPPPAPRQIRVPASAAAPAQVILLWLGFLMAQLDPAAPVTLILPLNESWADLIVGEPAVPQFFCVRATPKVLPLTTDIPYTLDPTFIDRSNQLIAAAVAHA